MYDSRQGFGVEPQHNTMKGRPLMTRKKDMTTTATAPPPTTANGRPRPAKIDQKGIDAAEANRTAVTLDSITDRSKRLTQAVGIIDAANEYLNDRTEIQDGREVTIVGNENLMKKMALSLALREGGVAVYDATSMSRFAFYKLTDRALGAGEHGTDGWKRPDSWDETVAARAKARKVLLYTNAATDLAPLAEEVIKAHARKRVATAYRDGIILELVDEGMSHSQIGALIGRERSRVTQIVSAARKAADR